MKKFLSTALVASTIAMAGGDAAPVTPIETPNTLNGFYIGAGYTYLDDTLGFYGVDLTDSQNAGTILGGYNYNDYIAFEGRYTFTSDFDIDRGYVNASGDTWGIYVKPQYPVSDDFKVYALLGYGDVKYIDNGDGFQYGLGAAYSATKNVELFADWTRLYDDDLAQNVDYTVDAFTVGINYAF